MKRRLLTSEVLSIGVSDLSSDDKMVKATEVPSHNGEVSKSERKPSRVSLHHSFKQELKIGA